MQYDVFISYARKDYADEQTKEVIPGNIVSRIKQLLDDNDITYWFDEMGIYSGDQFVGVLADAIEQSSIFLYISTEASNASKWTINEIATAKHLDKKIIPFRYDGSKYNNTVLMYLAPLDYIDYQGNKEKAFSQLLASVKAYKQGVEKTKREREMLAKRKKAKEELMFLAKEYRKRVAELNSVDAKKIVSVLRTMGITTHSCPVCKTEVDVEKTYCPACGWTISPIDDIEGADYLSLINQNQLEVVVSLYEQSISFEELLMKSQNLLEENEKLQIQVSVLTEQYKNAEVQFKEVTHKHSEVLRVKKEMEQSHRNVVAKVQTLEQKNANIQKEQLILQTRITEQQKQLTDREHAERQAKEECTRLRKILAEKESSLISVEKLKRESFKKIQTLMSELAQKEEELVLERTKRLQLQQSKALNSILSSVDIPDNKIEPPTSQYKKVDLGLSVCWAEHNIGASSPEKYGDYFAWGETEPKSNYTAETYKYYDKTKKTYIDIGKDISGTKYDVARAQWGGNWRMPRLEEIKELIDKCSWQWTELKGINGYKVTGPNGNSIFLPAAGYRRGGDVYCCSTIGYFWSAKLSWNSYAEDFNIRNGGYSSGTVCNRSYGLTVRPVTDK